MELEWVGVEDCGAVGLTEASPSETPVARELKSFQGEARKGNVLFEPLPLLSHFGPDTTLNAPFVPSPRPAGRLSEPAKPGLEPEAPAWPFGREVQSGPWYTGLP